MEIIFVVSLQLRIGSSGGCCDRSNMHYNYVIGGVFLPVEQSWAPEKSLFRGLSDGMEYRIRTVMMAVDVIRVEDGIEFVI